MKFAVEQSEGNRKAAYGQVHKAGCKDLKDPEGFEAVPTFEGVQEAAEGLMNWGEGDSYTYVLAPCAQAQLTKEGTNMAETTKPRYHAVPYTYQYRTEPSWFYVWDSKHKVQSGGRLTTKEAAQAVADMLNNQKGA